RADVRILAATHSDLEGLIAVGKFRPDLYFRLNVFTIRLPPLRERGDDVDLLTDHYLARFARQFGRPVPVVPESTRALLRGHPWPGNVRELQSVLKQGFLQMSGAVLLPEFLTLAAPAAPFPRLAGRGAASAVGALDWEGFISERLEAGSTDLYGECL